MSEQRPPAGWLLTPLVAFGGTLAGVLLLFFGQSELVPAVIGGYGAVCGSPDCALGIGILLIVGGFLALCASMIAGAVVGVLRRHDVDSRAAIRRGAFVAVWCLLAYVAESVLVWVLV